MPASRPEPAVSSVLKNEKPAQILLWTEVVPLGGNDFRVVPRRPRVEVEEISTVRACEILQLKSRSQLYYDIDKEPGASILKWRFTGPGRKRILWELPSVVAYKEALKGLGK